MLKIYVKNFQLCFLSSETVSSTALQIVKIMFQYCVFAESWGHTLLYYRGADKSLARPTSWCILFDG